jgi:tetratricopeptide (TPR) repeat protein
VGTAGAAKVWMETANQAAREGRYEASLSAIEALLASAPTHAAAWNLKGAVLAKLQRFAEAAAAVEEFLRLAPDTEHHKIKTAQGFLSNLRLVNTPDEQLDVEGLCGKAVTLHQFGRSAEAVGCFDCALSIDATCLQAWNDRALALEALQRSDEALASYDRALALQPDAAAVLFNRGNLLSSLSRGDEALESYRRFVAIAPAGLQHLVSDAKAKIARLDGKAAQVDPFVVEQCEGLRGCEYPALLNMAKTHLNMLGLMKPSTLERIVVGTRQLLDTDPNHHGALALLGYASLALHRARDGEPYFERAKAGASGAAALCGAYFHGVTSFRNLVEAGDAEAAGKALVDSMLSSIDAFADQTALQLGLKSLELGHCIIVSTAHGGLVVPVEGTEGRFSHRDELRGARG